MVKIRNILISVVLVVVVLAIIGYLLTPKETTPEEALPKETPPTASPYELRIEKIYYYNEAGKDTYAILDLSAKYNADGKWSVRGSGFMLLTDRGTVLRTVAMPIYLKDCFKNELLFSVDAVKYGYTRFQVAFRTPLNEKPVKLIYDEYGVKIELPVTEDTVSYVSYYDFVKVKLITKPPLSESDVIVSTTDSLLPREIGCYIAGSEFSVSIDVIASSFMRETDRIAVTKIETRMATLVDVAPKPPIILRRGEEARVVLVLRAPASFSYHGSLEVILTIEPAK